MEGGARIVCASALPLYGTDGTPLLSQAPGQRLCAGQRSCASGATAGGGRGGSRRSACPGEPHFRGVILSAWPAAAKRGNGGGYHGMVAGLGPQGTIGPSGHRVCVALDDQAFLIRETFLSRQVRAVRLRIMPLLGGRSPVHWRQKASDGGTPYCSNVKQGMFTC